ncbi:MAG: hypothetical protein H6Q17_2667 [Bacteroidetes bacterium]|nr:hypothetical protein [Bacteroidota bacterium]
MEPFCILIIVLFQRLCTIVCINRYNRNKKEERFWVISSNEELSRASERIQHKRGCLKKMRQPLSIIMNLKGIYLMMFWKSESVKYFANSASVVALLAHFLLEATALRIPS